MPAGAGDADKAALRAGLESLTTIEGIQQWHIGTPAATDRPVIERGYTFSWLLIFKNAEDEATYQTHPVHHAFVEQCKHLWEKVVVYDAV